MKRFEDEAGVVRSPDDERTDRTVIEVEDGAEIGFSRRTVFELRDVGQPLLVRPVCPKLTVQDVLCCLLGSRTNVLLPLFADDAAQATCLHESVDTLMVDVAIEPSAKIQGHSSIPVDAFGFLMYASQLFENLAILDFTCGRLMFQPLVVPRPRDAGDLT